MEVIPFGLWHIAEQLLNSFVGSVGVEAVEKNQHRRHDQKGYLEPVDGQQRDGAPGHEKVAREEIVLSEV